MIDAATAQVEVAPERKEVEGTRRSTRFWGFLAGVALAATIAITAVMVLGGEQPRPAVVTPTVVGDRDAAWIESLERQAQYRENAVWDKEEGLKQAEERRAAQATDKESALLQAEKRRAALDK